MTENQLKIRSLEELEQSLDVEVGARDEVSSDAESQDQRPQHRPLVSATGFMGC
jgi:hypothetical protein